MSLMGPPEGVVFDQMVALEVLSHSPAFVIREGKSVLLEQSVDSGDTVVPGIF